MSTNHRDTGRAEFNQATLTAYALGQLGEQERAAVEAQLVRNDKARLRVEEMRVFGKRVAEAARLGRPLQPSAALREAVEHRLDTLKDRPMSTTREPLSAEKKEKWGRLQRILVVAAGLLIVATPLYLAALVAQSVYHRAGIGSLASARSRPAATAAADEEQRDRNQRPAVSAKAPGPQGQPESRSGRETVAYAEGKEYAREGVAAQGNVGETLDPSRGGNVSTSVSAVLHDPKPVDRPGGLAPVELAGAAPQPAKDGGLRMMVEPRIVVAGEGEAKLGQSRPSSGRPSDLSGPSDSMSLDLWGMEGRTRGEAAREVIDAAPYGRGASRGQRLAPDAKPLNEARYFAPGKPAPSPPPSPSTTPQARLVTTGGSQGSAAGHGIAGIKGIAGGEKIRYDDKRHLYYDDKGRTFQFSGEDTAPDASSGPGNVQMGQTLETLHRRTPRLAAQGDALGSEVTRESLGPLDVVVTRLKRIAAGSTARQPPAGDLARKDGLGRSSSQLSILRVDGEPAADAYDTASLHLHYGRERGRTRLDGRPEVPGTEQYEAIAENPFLSAEQQPLSTFSIDVDTASYANVRRFLTEGRLPPPQAVRIEEMVNYFQYEYPLPEDDVPFAVDTEVAQCPWNGDHRLVRIGLKGQEIDRSERGPSSLVFLLDVSGSMRDANKLPLVKQAMSMLVDQLTEDDRVAIVTYASNAGVQLESTGGHDRQRIRQAIDALSAGGSTHGSAGIQLAYQQAASYFVTGGTNRVILATDGDLNVGITDDDELVELIKEKAAGGVFLTVLGFGTGNLKDAKMEKLADHGNGVYAYIDSLREARRVLVEQLSGSLVTIAKDVKIQIEFNPAEVDRYRLIGYENRVMPARDFNDDKKDAGEIGAGHTVTALYEIVPAGAEGSAADSQPKLKYQRPPRRPLTRQAASGELLSLRLRYKRPDAQQSELLEFVATDSDKRFGEASADFRFASAVASFGMVLRGSPHSGGATFEAVEEYAAAAIGEDPQGYRTELVDLVRRARQLRPR